MPICTIEGNTGTIAETGTTPHAAAAECSNKSQAILQGLWRATGTMEGTLL